MFNFRRNNEERKFKGNTIYVLKYDDLHMQQSSAKRILPK